MAMNELEYQQTLLLDPAYEELVSPQRFLEIVAEEPNNIESATVIPPKLGRHSFGKILIKRKRPVFRTRLAPISR